MLPFLAALAFAQDVPVTLHVGDPAPKIAVKRWIKGAPVTRLGHGSVTVLEFWATWCVPCRVTIPELTRLAHKYRGKATFCGVSIWEHEGTDLGKVRAYVAAMGPKMDYRVGTDLATGTMGTRWMLAAGYPNLPIAFVVDRRGRVAFIGHPMDNLDEVVGKVIAGTFDPKAEVARQARDKRREDHYQELIVPIQVDLQAKKYREALGEIDAAMKEDPSYPPRLAFIRFTTLQRIDDQEARKYAVELSQGLFKADADALSSLAWNLKDGDQALPVTLAERAAKLRGYNDPDILDTLAQVYERAGRLAEALRVERRAVSIAEKSKDVSNDQRRSFRATLDRLQKKFGAG